MDTPNPYTPPASEVIDITLPEPAPFIPPKVLSQIKQAWVAGLISGAITLLVTLIAVAGKSLFGVGVETFVDVALIFGLSWGIYRKSRACAVIMVIYFLVSKAVMLSESHLSAVGVVVSLAFLYCYIQGVRGTYAYHRLVREGAPAS